MSMREERLRMVERQIESRGVTDPNILRAMATVPREEFVAAHLRDYAYEDAPLPIEDGQTISQPFVVALMIDALDVQPGDRVLEIGAGSGYAAAVLGQMADSVYAIERHQKLAEIAAKRMDRLGYDNVEILHGDGTQGLIERAPFDAILVSAGGPDVPKSLREQLAIGGRLVIPVGEEPRMQELLHVRRTDEHTFEQRSLGRVQFVPLIGSEGWAAEEPTAPAKPKRPLAAVPDQRRATRLIAQYAEPFDSIDEANLDALLERIGDAKVVLIGEASHGTSEFYEMRARITKDLIERRGFNIVAIEGDWPDTAALDSHVRDIPGPRLREQPFSDFPRWMWRNDEMRRFVRWLSEHNDECGASTKVSIHGLDLYSLNNSIGVVLDYLERVDPEAAEAARVRFACFSPWETDPAVYGRAAITGETRGCENDAVAALQDLLARQMAYIERDGESFFDAAQNAAVIRNAERYYRTMYYGSRESWNLRDTHMFDTLRAVLSHRGPKARAVVWAHNSHIGNAAATEMGIRGELNIGQLVRETYGSHAYSIGFGTHTGTVAAASNWGEPVQIMHVRPSNEESYEHLCHDTGIRQFLLPLRGGNGNDELRKELSRPRLERAIGVIYRPQMELLSHYFQAALPVQFDEYVWFDETKAVRAIDRVEAEGADTYPFAL